MSDGRCFSKPQELSIEDRLSELERKIPILLERLQSYDMLIHKVKELEISVTSLGNHYGNFVNEVDQSKKEQQQQINLISWKLDTCTANLQSLIDTVSENKSAFDKKIDALGITHFNLETHLDSFKRIISDTQSRSATKDSLLQLENYHEDQKNAIHTILGSIQGNLIGVQDSVESSKTMASVANGNVQSLTCKVYDLRQDIEGISSQSALDRKNLNSFIENVIPSIKKEVSVVIDNFRKEIQQNSSNPITIKDELQKKMDLIELDGKNAVLRATNNERNVEMMKKQIENLYLLLKKYELSQ